MKASKELIFAEWASANGWWYDADNEIWWTKDMLNRNRKTTNELIALYKESAPVEAHKPTQTIRPITKAEQQAQGDAMIYVSPPPDVKPSASTEAASGVERKLVPDGEQTYFPVECRKCGWAGSSESLEGGGQIADTGDYSDGTCPICLSNNLDDADNLQNSESAFDRLETAHAYIKKFSHDNYHASTPPTAKPEAAKEQGEGVAEFLNWVGSEGWEWTNGNKVWARLHEGRAQALFSHELYDLYLATLPTPPKK